MYMKINQSPLSPYNHGERVGVRGSDPYMRGKIIYRIPSPPTPFPGCEG
jgi:hypothetical protein